MAEFSMFWTTGTTGDGANPYTMAQVTAWLRRTLTPGQAGGGVLKGHGNELAVTGSSSPVTVGTGGAVVYGYPYENDAAASVAIPTPSGVTRIDRIVLRASWAAQTVRITRVAGTEGGGAPALTQNPGTTYDIPLAQVSITPGGAITITDERVFCVFGTAVPSANIVDGAITTAKLAAGVLSADATGRAKMANGFVTDAQVAASAGIAQSKISNAVRTIDAAKLQGKAASDFAKVADARMYSLTGDDDHPWAIPGPSASYSDVTFQNYTGTWAECEFTLGAKCDIKIDFSATLKGAPGAGTFDFRVMVDGTATEPESHSAIFTGALHFSAMWPFPELAAGTHKVKIQFRHDQGNAVNPGIGGRSLAVTVYPRP